MSNKPTYADMLAAKTNKVKDSGAVVLDTTINNVDTSTIETYDYDSKDITIESPDKELAGNTASQLELLTAVKNRDLRVFQDGIYIVNKAGKDLEWKNY